MGLFGAHQGNDNGRGHTSVFAQNLAVMLAGLLAFYISFSKVIPNDLFTSALFFDALGLEPVFNRPAALFAEGGIWEDLPNVTEEAFVFALSLLLIQFLIGYRASVAGGYTSNSSNLFSLFFNTLKGTEKIGRASLNWGKVGWIAFYWAISIFDTYTDTAFRSGFGANGGVFRALLVSFFYYNLASEWMLMVGFKTIVDYGIRLAGDVKKMSRNVGFAGGFGIPSSPQRRPPERSMADALNLGQPKRNGDPRASQRRVR